MNERVEWEAKRVAAAFGVQEWDEQVKTREDFVSIVSNSDFSFVCCIDNQACITSLTIEDAQDVTVSCHVNFLPEGYCLPCLEVPSYNERMVRGLYRLGLEEPSLIAELPTLSAHEKLELSLSLPREFWPKAWIEKEAENA